MNRFDEEDFFEMGKILVWLKEPGKKARHVWISPSLANLQKTVGGYIESHQIATDLILLCDEEGRFKDYEPNVHVVGVEFVGTLLLVGQQGEDFSSCKLTPDQMRKMFPEWMVEG